MNPQTIDYKQIGELLIAQMKGGRLDARKFSQKIRKWALDRGLIIRNKTGKYQFPERKDDRYIARYETPPQTILYLMEKEGIFKNGSIGISITKAKFWNFLDIHNSTYSLYQERDRREQEEVLIRLHQEGLVFFQSAGSIWDLRRCQSNSETEKNKNL